MSTPHPRPAAEEQEAAAETRTEKAPPKTADDYIKLGDKEAQAGEYVAADDAYLEAWNLCRNDKELPAEQKFWLLFTVLNVKYLAKDYQKAFGMLQLIAQYFEAEIFVGNPLFHLRVGQLYHELEGGGKNPRIDDELARALIGGGVEIFDGEDPKFLARIRKVLKPPAGAKSWEATRGQGGATRDRLNGAGGFLAALLKQKLGKAPPYK